MWLPATINQLNYVTTIVCQHHHTHYGILLRLKTVQYVRLFLVNNGNSESRLHGATSSKVVVCIDDLTLTHYTVIGSFCVSTEHCNRLNKSSSLQIAKIADQGRDVRYQTYSYLAQYVRSLQEVTFRSDKFISYKTHARRHSTRNSLQRSFLTSYQSNLVCCVMRHSCAFHYRYLHDRIKFMHARLHTWQL
jgi:hypothetical protein